MEMKDKDGKVRGVLQIGSPQDENVLDKIIAELRPGTGKGIYIPGAGERRVSQQTNYEPVSWHGGLDALKEKASPWTLLFPAHAEPADIRVYYGFDNLTDHEIDEMIAESEATGNSVVVRDLKANHTLVGTSIIYSECDGSFEFRIFGTTKSSIQTPPQDQYNVEQLTIRGNPAVFLSNRMHQQLIWIEVEPGGKALQYEILAEQGSRDWMNVIAESLR